MITTIENYQIIEHALGGFTVKMPAGMFDTADLKEIMLCLTAHIEHWQRKKANLRKLLELPEKY